jgi:hypothetical protein
MDSQTLKLLLPWRSREKSTGPNPHTMSLQVPPQSYSPPNEKQGDVKMRNLLRERPRRTKGEKGKGKAFSDTKNVTPHPPLLPVSAAQLPSLPSLYDPTPRKRFYHSKNPLSDRDWKITIADPSTSVSHQRTTSTESTYLDGLRAGSVLPSYDESRSPKKIQTHGTNTWSVDETQPVHSSVSGQISIAYRLCRKC